MGNQNRRHARRGLSAVWNHAFWGARYYGPRYFGPVPPVGATGGVGSSSSSSSERGGRWPGEETRIDREARIKADRIRMGILPPDLVPLDATPPTPPSEGGARGGAINRHEPYSLTAHLLPEDLAGLEALAARAAQLTMDQEIALWLKLDQQRRLHEAWLRDEDDAAVLMLAIATIH